MGHRVGGLGLELLLTACAGARPGLGPEPGPAMEAGPPAKLEPAPMPHGSYVRRNGTVGALELPIPPKMPLGTGAVPVSGGSVRGTVSTGLREAF